MSLSIRKMLELRNEYQLHAIQTFHTPEINRFWFLVYDTCLIWVEGESVEFLKDLGEEEILKWFRESILPTY